MCSISLFSVALGLSTSYAMAITIRFFLGLTDCLVPIARIMVPEILGPAKAVIGMALIPGARSVGVIIGPAMGGFLAQPAVRHPTSFPPTGIFARCTICLERTRESLFIYTWMHTTVALNMLRYFGLPL
ncbi:unnamed protein product [Ascophyllum nodosum]